MLNIIELVLSPVGIPSWCITNKFPVISNDSEVIGICGNIQDIYDGTPSVGNNNFFFSILQYIDNNFNKKISIKKIAQHFNISPRSIERYFKNHLKISPEQFLIKTRIFKSCDYLKKGEYISTAALECGFYDQSSFTRQFKKHMGLTPLQYIKEFIEVNIKA
jgi:AraC-like DNA-binding protein